ncbi:MAG TPA: ScpA family protein [Candidatus Dormibacteraeota bacterium]
MDGAGEPDSARVPATVTLESVPGEAGRVRVAIPGYTGPLDELVRQAQRGDVDLSSLSVAAITDGFRRFLDADPGRAQLQDIADFLTLAARLVALKAATVLPDATAGAAEDAEEIDGGDAGRRLAEYRLFKAAADALLGGPVEEGARSFLGLVSPEVIPVERMRIPPERLAAAFRSVLERLSAAEPLPVGVATFSVEEKMADLRERLRAGPLRFEELFAGVATRLEAVACFLALLELLRRDEACVDQAEPFGPITVTANG